MKVAIVHELLTVRGGAERVARVLAGMYPQADVFTLLYNEATLGDWFPKERIRTSFLQRIPGLLPSILSPLASRLFNHHLYLPFFRAAVEAWDFTGYDLVISSSSAFVHGLKVPAGTAHVTYVHTPARYLWDQTFDVRSRMPTVLRPCASRLFHRLRTWDAGVADRATAIAAASNVVRRRIELYWNREAEIVHPFADDAWFVTPAKATPTPDGPFVVVANLSRYKRIDRAIAACANANLPLEIVGTGPALAELKEKARGANVVFRGHMEGEALRELYKGARALLIPGIEDFGINAIEALACGTPVVTARGGGTTDAVDASVGATCDPSDDAFAQAVANANLRIDPRVCRTRAERFTRHEFEHKMYTLIDAVISATANASR